MKLKIGKKWDCDADPDNLVVIEDGENRIVAFIPECAPKNTIISCLKTLITNIEVHLK